MADVENFVPDGLDKKVTRPSKSPRSSPLVMVKKKDCTTGTDDSLGALSGAKLFHNSRFGQGLPGKFPSRSPTVPTVA